MPIKLSWECDSTLVSKVSVYKSTEDFDIKDLPNPVYTSDNLIKEYIDDSVETFVKYHYLVSVQTDSDSVYFSPKVEITPKDYSKYLVVHLPFNNPALEDLGTEKITWSPYYHSNTLTLVDDVDNNGNPIKAASFDYNILKSNKDLSALNTEDFTIKIVAKPLNKNGSSIHMWARYLNIGRNSDYHSFFIASNVYQENGQVHTEARPNGYNQWLTDSPYDSYPDNIYKTITIVRESGIFYQYSDNALLSINSDFKNYSIPPKELFIGGNESGRELIRAYIQDIKIYKGVAIHPNKN